MFFVGKGYVCEGLFKMNTASKVNQISPQVFIVEFCGVWHGRLGNIGLKF